MAGAPYDQALRRGGLVPLTDENARVDAARAEAQAVTPEARAKTETDAAHAKRLIERVRRCWTLVEDAESKQRARELEDLKFSRGSTEDQWPAEILQVRQGGVVAGVYVPARPCLTVPKIKQPIAQICNEARAARLGIEIRAKGDQATTEGAELRQGMIRAIEVDSNAQHGRMFGLERAVKCGRGYYRVTTEFANDGDFDLDIVIKPIRRQGSIYLDPSHEEFDGSDMTWAFEISDLTADEFRARFGRAPSTGDLFESDTDVPATWKGEDFYRVAMFWYVESVKRELVYDPILAQLGAKNGRTFADQLPEEWQDTPQTKRRPVYDRQVKCAIVTGYEVLEEYDWPGRWIPILQILGEVHEVDGQETVYKGATSDAKDGQRVYNYVTSLGVEGVALAPRVPYVMAGGQQEGYEKMWAESHSKNLPYVLYNPVEYNGHLVPPPMRQPVGDIGIEATLAARAAADQDIKAVTGRFDPSLGQLSGERSGKAIDALKVQGEISSSHFLDNLASITMRHEARILLDLLPKVYDRPGRVIRLLGDDENDERQVILGQPFVPGPDGRPVALQPGAPPPMGEDGRPLPVHTYDLQAGGDYAVAISVGRAQQTQREANLQVIQAMIEGTKGAIAPMLADIWAEQLDGPMAKRLAKRLRTMNPQIAAADKGEQAAIPPEAQAQIQQMQQQLQEMQQALAEAQDAAKGHTIRAQAQVEQARLDAESRERIAGLETEAKLRVETARLERELENQITVLEKEQAFAARDREDKQAHDFALQQAKLQAEADIRAKQAAEQLAWDRQKHIETLSFQREDSEASRRHAADLAKQRAEQSATPRTRKVKRDERGLISEIEE